MRVQVILSLLLQLIFEFSCCSRLHVISGSSVELPCLLIQNDFPAAAITWKFNGEDITQHLSDSVKIKDNGFHLSISRVTPANEGDYVCLLKDDKTEMIGIYNVTVDDSVSIIIKVTQGSDVHIPCYLPASTTVQENAVWSTGTNDGERKTLNFEDDSTNDNKKLERLYPFDRDQSIILRQTVMEDAGTYHCESADGVKLVTVHLIVAAPPEPSHTCTNFTTAWEPCEDENSRTGAPMLQESITEFSMKIFSFLRESHPSTNLLFSPISMNGLLSHLLLGARGETRKALERAVYLPHDFYCVHFQMKKLREKLTSSLQMASQIFYNPHMNLSESFINQSIEYYEAEPTKLLETSEENIQMINSWVADKTQNKITQLVDYVSPDAQLILLNAVSFNGQWKIKFGLKPKKGHFTKLNGDLVTVPVLYDLKYMVAMAYVVDLKAQVARFALSGDSSLYILLPRTNKATDLQQVEERMTDTAVHHMIELLKTTPPQHVEVTLPLIKLDAQPDMNILIKKLGLSSLFEGANLCGLSPEDKVLLDDARHRAFLVLTEQGVEAAAASSMAFSRSFPSFTAMRPFILLLWSDEANVPLFVGRVTDP